MARTVTDKRLNRAAPGFNTVVDNICRGQYVLVLGSDIILDKDSNEENAKANGDITRFLLNRVIQNQRNEGKDYPNAETFPEFIINNALNSIDVRSWLFDVLATTDYDIEDINPDLVRLLATKCFRVVLTTVFDPSIELLMEKVWGKNNYRVMSVFNHTDVNFDFKSNEFLGDEYFDIKPTLYYVFGKANYDDPGQYFVLDDNDTLDGISKWLGENAPQKLLAYLSTKKLLALGCNLKDWCFRFFWYALRNKDCNRLKEGDIAVLLQPDKSEQDKNLYDYLNKTIKVRVQTNSREYIHRLADALDENLIANTSLTHSLSGGIFISYASEDFAIAWNIFTRLREAGFNVWLDNQKLSVSDEYDNRIARAINECKVFIPLLTSTVASYLDADKDKYFRDEWEQAAGENTNIFFCPIVTYNYNYKSDYHKKVPEKIRKATVFDWTKEPFKKLVNKIQTALNL